MEFHFITVRDKHLFTVKRFARCVHEGEEKGVAFSKTTATDFELNFFHISHRTRKASNKKQEKQIRTFIITTQFAARRCRVKRSAIVSSERPLKCLRRQTIASLFIRLRNLNFEWSEKLQHTKTASEFTWVTECIRSHTLIKLEILSRETLSFLRAKNNLPAFFKERTNN